MKRRTFLKGVIAATVAITAPIAVIKAVKTTEIPQISFEDQKNLDKLVEQVFRYGSPDKTFYVRTEAMRGLEQFHLDTKHGRLTFIDGGR